MMGGGSHMAHSCHISIRITRLLSQCPPAPPVRVNYGSPDALDEPPLVGSSNVISFTRYGAYESRP